MALGHEVRHILLPLAGEGGRRSRPDEGRRTLRYFRSDIAEGDFRRMARLPTLIRHASHDTFSRKREKERPQIDGLRV